MPGRAPRAKSAPRRAVRDYARAAYTEAILAAAERLFLRVGYHDAKMADLASEAGVAVGTLYKYFESKEDVFASLAARGRKEISVMLQGCLDQTSPLERLRVVVDRSFAFAENHGALLAIYTQLGFVSELQIRSAGGDRAEHTLDRFLTVLESIFRDASKTRLVRKDLPPAQLASALAGIMNTTVYAWIRAGRSYSLVDRAGPVLQLFLEGARAK